MSTDNTNAALAADTAPPEVVRPKISDYRRHLLICTGPRCAPDGAAQDLFDSLGAKFKAAGLNDGELRVKRSRVGCFAACKGGPVMCVQPDGTWYYNVNPRQHGPHHHRTPGGRAASAGAGVSPGARRGVTGCYLFCSCWRLLHKR